MIEIERKFLVTSEVFKTEAFNRYAIKQGFLNSHKERTVRIRLKENEGYLTVKGKSSEDGLVRFEWERVISKTDAEALLQLCEEGVIDKMRYEVKSGNHTFEVDEFFGNNKGLVMAEVELKTENETFERPNWLGKEVTGDIKYYNSQLCAKPFSSWS